MKNRIAIVGAGAAGLMAAWQLNIAGIVADLYEKNDKVGRKLGITGKGRCNLTNNCTPQDFLEQVVNGGKFLRSAIYRYNPQWLISFVEQNGVPLKTERGGRVFPASDRAADIVNLFRKGIKGKNIRLIKDEITAIKKEGSFILSLSGGAQESYDILLIATGGLSYGVTGSTGDGYVFAKNLGHSIVLPRPSLVGVNCAGDVCARLQGLTLKNVGLSIVSKDGRTLFSDMGELLFTQSGLSGPMILTASAKVKELSNTSAVIDLKPALDEKILDARLLRDFGENQNKALKNSLSELLPAKLIPVIVERSGIDPLARVNLITKAQRQHLVKLLKGFCVGITELRPITEAVITSGGVDLSEINPGTMESKITENLYFAGEVMDVDALTGGYNLHIAFATAAAAAAAIEKKEKGGDEPCR